MHPAVNLIDLLSKKVGEYTASDIDKVVTFAAGKLPFSEGVIRQTARVLMAERPGETLQAMVSSGELQKLLTAVAEKKDASLSVFAFCDACKTPVETSTIYVESGGKRAIVPCPLCDHLIQTTVN